MLVAIAILLIIGVLIDWAFRRVAVPGLVGLLIVGVIGGAFLLGWISPSLIALSEELRLGALIIILLRAGLEVSRESLRQVGGRVLLLAIVPAVIEGLAIIFLTVPIFVPIIEQLGFDLIWFGVVMIMIIEISLITPPIGLNVFVMKSMLPEVPLIDIFQGIGPFFIGDIFRLLVVAFVPGMVLWLPSFMR